MKIEEDEENLYLFWAFVGHSGQKNNLGVRAGDSFKAFLYFLKASQLLFHL